LPSPPLSLSQKRERRGRRTGEYIKGKEFVIYIYYILKTPFTFYILPFPALLGEDRGVYQKGKEFSIYILYIYNINIYV